MAMPPMVTKEQRDEEIRKFKALGYHWVFNYEKGGLYPEGAWVKNQY